MSWIAEIQAWDESLLHTVRGTPGWAVPVFFVLTVVGGGWGMFALVPFLIWQRTRTLTLWLIGTIVATSSLVSSIKALVARVRPCDALGWCVPIGIVSPGGGSFPSGHAAGSFAFAAFVSVMAPRYAPLLILYAALVAWSRCVLGVHYPSDVFAGALLGSSIGWGAATWTRQRQDRRGGFGEEARL